MTTSLPKALGHYEILGPLGSGGMGEVYVARDPILGRKVAIKVLPHRLSADRETLSRFTQEARSASALNHPNIVTIYEVGTDGGVPYIVMEHIEGRDLRSMIAEGPLTTRKALEIAAQIADGLAAAHEQGIVHRDLKPENLMLTKDGYVKILDFGLAKVIRSAPPEDSDETMLLDVPGTNPGTILGTVGYMSPEQATGRRIDFRSDQFALGAILYELATGKGAFERENAIDTLSAILHDEPPPVRDFNVKAPAPFCWVIERLLSKEPDERYASTRDLARELRALRDRVAAEGSSLDVPRPARVKRRHMQYAVIAAAASVVLIGIVLTWLSREPASAPAATGAATTTTAPAKPRRYLAVLRFNDLSGDASGQLVADGLAETLTARLARIPTVQVMRVPPDTAVDSDPQQVARQLGVNLVLRGSMQRETERLRVSYSILDASNRSEVTGDTIDGTMTDLFDVQDKLVASVAMALDPGAVVEKAARLDPRVSQKRYLEALGHLRRHDQLDSLNTSIKMLEELDSTASSASVQAALGRAYLAKFSHTREDALVRKASVYCERALASDPQNPEVHITLGQALMRTGRLPEAIGEFNTALSQQPNSVDAIVGLAEAYAASGDPAKSEVAFKRAIAQQPGFWQTYNRAGVFYANQARYPESVQMFEKVIQLVPDNLFGYNNLGGVYQMMGRYDDAIGVFTRTIELKPTAQGYSNLGTCYYYLGRYKDAATVFRKAIEIAPNSFRYWGNLGDALRWIPGGEKEALECFDKAIKLLEDELRVNPQDAYFRARYAECLAKRGLAGRAHEHLAMALAGGATDMRVLYRAALIYAIVGDDTNAVKFLDQALRRGYNRTEAELDPEFARLRRTEAFQRALRGGV